MLHSLPPQVLKDIVLHVVDIPAAIKRVAALDEVGIIFYHAPQVYSLTRCRLWEGKMQQKLFNAKQGI